MFAPCTARKTTAISRSKTLFTWKTQTTPAIPAILTIRKGLDNPINRASPTTQNSPERRRQALLWRRWTRTTQPTGPLNLSPETTSRHSQICLMRTTTNRPPSRNTSGRALALAELTERRDKTWRKRVKIFSCNCELTKFQALLVAAQPPLLVA